MTAMYKERDNTKMIDIYEADLEDYFKYLLKRVNKFLNSRPDYTGEKIIHNKNNHIRRKAS